jgi:hypothetical protein
VENNQSSLLYDSDETFAQQQERMALFEQQLDKKQLDLYASQISSQKEQSASANQSSWEKRGESEKQTMGKAN